MHISWFLTNGFIMTITIFVGEYICLKLEQNEIILFDFKNMILN